jgi:hypothetical protein
MADSHDATGLPSSGPLAPLLRTDARLAVSFLRMFYQNGPWWVVAIHPSPPPNIPAVTVRKFADSDQLRQYIAAASGTVNLYHIANPHGGGLQKPPHKTEMIGARCLFADIDLPPDTPNTPENLNLLLAKVKDLRPPPSPIVFTGNGFHPYWLFPKVIYTTQEPDIIERTEAVNRAIADDLGSDRTWNINRIMRLPYTINIPTKIKLERGRTPIETFILPDTVNFDQQDTAGEIY